MAVKIIHSTPKKVVLIINNSGSITNIYGMIKAATASFEALIPVRIGSPPEIPVAAKAAKATGGVISATIPK